MSCNRNSRRISRCGRLSESIITERRGCLGAPETLAEELYDAPYANRLILKCCDSLNGCRDADSRRRCEFWPRFAHPRWLTCRELNKRRIR